MATVAAFRVPDAPHALHGGVRQNTSTVSAIVRQCFDFLESHLCRGAKWGLEYHFYRPSLEKYSADQWLWDSSSHMIVWSHRNVTNAVLALRTLLQMQQVRKPLEPGRKPQRLFAYSALSYPGALCRRVASYRQMGGSRR